MWAPLSALAGFVWVRMAVPGFVWFCLASLVFAWLYSTLHDFTWLCLDLSVCLSVRLSAAYTVPEEINGRPYIFRGHIFDWDF